MLQEWIAPLSVAEFTATHLQRRPFAGARTARTVIPLLQWETLGRILAVVPAADILIVAKGRHLDITPPRTLAQLEALLAAGVGCTVRRVAQYDSGLAALAEQFSHELPGRIDLHLFVTPGGTHGLGWHYDNEDVFIVQTAGCKDYYFRENSAVHGRPGDAPVDVALFPREVSPIATARLLAGDVLYVPARWWHVALCTQRSLSLSLGLTPVFSNSWSTTDRPSPGGHPRKSLRSSSA